MTTTTTTNTLSTIAEVISALKSIGLDGTVPVLAAISRHGKADFLSRLSLCIENKDTDGVNRKHIEHLLNCMAPETLASLMEIVPEITVDAITVAATQTPIRILSVIATACDKSAARHQEAVSILKGLAPRATPAADPVPAAPPISGGSKPSVPQDSSSRQPQQRVAPPPVSSPKPADRGGDTQGMREDPEAKQYRSHHVYGSSFALCFNATVWNGEPGIMVDAATTVGPNNYDWKQAIHIWLNPIEVAACVAVFRRWRPGVVFDAHGNQNNKSFSLEFQKTHYFAKISAKVDAGKVRAVKIASGDATAVSILFLRQLGEAYKGIPLTEILATLRATHQLEHAA